MIDPLDTYLRLVFPWETEHQQLYKSVMWKFVPRDQTYKGTPLANYAAQSFDDLKRLIESRKNRPMHDMWIALGTQRMVHADKKSTDGFPKAIRQIPNMVSFKSIWIDVDVKEDAYATTADAVADVTKFVAAKGLPAPTMVVFSGSGGMHVYWCVDIPMPVEQWKGLATALRDCALDYKLKFDPQVTVNAAGVLRIPTTFNYKREPVGHVSLYVPASEQFQVYSYQQLSGALAAYMGQVGIIRQTQSATGHGVAGNFTTGLTGTAPPITLTDVAASCPLTADTLTRGGRGDPEPLWNMLMLLASFTDDPDASAHALSSGDPRYSQAETDRKLAEKVAYRAATNAGWPSCATFNSLSSACKACPLLAQQKTPLHFAIKPANAPPGAAPAIADELVPAPFFRGVDNHIYGAVLDKEGNSQTIDLFGREILDAGIDRENNQLIFKTLIMGMEYWVPVPVSTTNQLASLIGALSKAPSGGIQIAVQKRKKVEEFIVAWITHLQQQRKFVAAQTYGWDDKLAAFTYGETMYGPTKNERANLGKAFDTRFKETGDLKPWQDAMALVYGKPWLEAIVATSFGAPLAALLNGGSPVLSAYSAASGVGKSTAMQLAQSVWGHPISGMSSLDDTENSVKKKIADLKSLPAYWDELITAEATEKVVNLVFAFTQGKAKSRLTSNSEQMEANTFTTMFTISSNHGVLGGLYAGSSGTEAGGLRVFEIEAIKTRPTHSAFDAGNLMSETRSNFGCAGARYADFVVKNKPLIMQILKAMVNDLDAKFHFEQKERFWRTTMALILTGATLANSCRITTFDIIGLARFLGEELMKQRVRLGTQASVTMNGTDAVLDLLNKLQSELQGRHMVTTNIVPAGGGRPPPVELMDTDVMKLTDVWMQVGALDGRIRMASDKFNAWILKSKHNPDHIRKLLSQHYDLVEGRFTIGAGVPMLNAGTFGLHGRRTVIDLTPKITSSGSTLGSP